MRARNTIDLLVFVSNSCHSKNCGLRPTYAWHYLSFPHPPRTRGHTSSRFSWVLQVTLAVLGRSKVISSPVDKNKLVQKHWVVAGRVEH